MGKFGLSNPTVAFVIEVIKTLERDDLEQVARALSEQLSKRQVIDISSAKSTPQDSSDDESSPDPSLTVMLQNLLGKNGTQNLLGNENNLEKLLGLLKGKGGKPTIDNAAAALNSISLPTLMQLASQFMNSDSGSRSPEEDLFDAMLPLFGPRRREQVQSLKPIIKMFSMFQSMTGKKFNLSKLANIFKSQTQTE